MISIANVQAYLRRSAHQHYEAVTVPPFTLFFHPTDALSFFNYAIPDEPVDGDIAVPIARLRAEFAFRERRPRFEFIEGYAPNLPLALRVYGFDEESRLHLMVCTPQAYRPVPAVVGLSVMRLSEDSPLSDVHDFLTTQRLGFTPDESVLPAPTEAAGFRRRLQAGGGVLLARLNGEPVAAGSFSAPFDGLTEVGGIATLEAFRRRGIASALTGEAIRMAFDEGAEAAVLSAADERAGRVYERIGFRSHATMLAYIDSDAAEHEATDDPVDGQQEI